MIYFYLIPLFFATLVSCAPLWKPNPISIDDSKENEDQVTAEKEFSLAKAKLIDDFGEQVAKHYNKPWTEEVSLYMENENFRNQRSNAFTASLIQEIKKTKYGEKSLNQEFSEKFNKYQKILLENPQIEAKTISFGTGGKLAEFVTTSSKDLRANQELFIDLQGIRIADTNEKEDSVLEALVSQIADNTGEDVKDGSWELGYDDRDVPSP